MTSFGTTAENKKAMEEMNRAIKDYANECAVISEKIDRLIEAKNKLNGYGWFLAARRERTDYVGRCLQDDWDWKGLGKNIARLNFYYVTEDWKRMDDGREFVIGYIDAEIERLTNDTNFINLTIGRITNDIKDLEKAIKKN